MALTKKDIFEVADELAVKGEKVTQLTVREVLGSGSFSTIAEALREWRELQDEEAELQEAELPKEIDNELRSFGMAMWKQAQSIAVEGFSEERKVLRRAKEDAMLEVEETRDAIKVLEKEDIEKSNEINELKNKIESLEEKNQSLKLKNGELLDEVGDITKLKDGFYNDYVKIKNAYDQLEKVKYEAEAANKFLSSSVEKLEAELEKSKTDLEKVKQAHDSCQSANENLEVRYDTLQAANDKIKALAAQTEGRLDESRNAYSKLEGKNEVLAENIEKASKELESWKAEVSKKETIEKAQAAKIKELECKLKASNNQPTQTEKVTSKASK